MANNKYENLLVLYNSGLDFFISYFERKGIQTKPSYKQSALPSRVLRRIFKSLNLSQGFWYGDWKKQIQSLKTIIVFADLHPEVLTFIKSSNKDIRIIYWYWDPVFRLAPPKKWMYKTAEMWSFDPADCIKYGFDFNTTFYFTDISLPKNPIEYDVIFIGNDKGRIEYLKLLQSRFQKLGIKGYYHVITNKKRGDKPEYKPIPYVEYLQNLSKAKVLIDILPVGQSGLTIRAMESIFFQKN